MNKASPFLIRGFVQNYAWGRIGSESIIPGLAGLTPENIPYAELWFGDHPNGPSGVDGMESTLRKLIESDPTNYLGRTFERLPFLLKVLTVRRPLSIQLHPNASQAVELNRRNSKMYPDPLPKPEIAYAISKLSMLVGFRTMKEVQTEIGETPELSCFSDGAASVSDIFENILRAPTSVLAEQCQKLELRLKKKGALNLREGYCQQLFADYPEGDAGLFGFFLMNIVTLNPGEVIFTEAGVPHAYLSGDLIECMANSDNVVRAGLTPKAKDVETLLTILDRKEGSPALLAHQYAARGMRRFMPPRCQFALEVFSSGEHRIEPNGGPSIIFVLSGEGRFETPNETLSLEKGSSIFVPGIMEQAAKLSCNGEIFRAFAVIP